MEIAEITVTRQSRSAALEAVGRYLDIFVSGMPDCKVVGHLINMSFNDDHTVQGVVYYEEKEQEQQWIH